MREEMDREMIWAHEKLLSGHPVPEEHPVEGHPKVHPHDILDDLYHASMHGSQRAPTQHRDLRRRVERNDASAELSQVHADIGYGGGSALTTSIRWTMLEQHDEVLRRVKRKILDPHAQVVHDETPLPVAVARQPRGDEPSRGAKILQGFGE